MIRAKHPPALLLILLMAVSLRMTFAAPFCMPQMMAGADIHAGHDHAQHAHMHHGEHGMADSGVDSGSSGHEGHEGHQQCCSACGPSLPPELATLDLRAALREAPTATPIRALATRPPFPAYDARGPPLLI